MVNDTLERFELNESGLSTVNVIVFDAVISSWLTLWDDFRNVKVPEWVDYADIYVK